MQSAGSSARARWTNGCVRAALYANRCVLVIPTICIYLVLCSGASRTARVSNLTTTRTKRTWRGVVPRYDAHSIHCSEQVRYTHVVRFAIDAIDRGCVPQLPYAKPCVYVVAMSPTICSTLVHAILTPSSLCHSRKRRRH